jgi:hypothetical protein
MTTVDSRALLRVQDSLLHVLAEQQQYRPIRTGLIDGELSWIVAERLVMFATVNRLRSNYGLPPIQLSSVQRAERQAVGHSDYSKKFALYCAELVLKENPPV